MILDLSPIYTGWLRSFPTSFGFPIPIIGVRAVGDGALAAGQVLHAICRRDWQTPLVFFPANNIPSQKVESVGNRRVHCAAEGITQC